MRIFACLLASVLAASFSSSSVAARSDFNADGKVDLVVRSSANGQIAGYAMDGLAISAANALIGPGNWTATHTADLNGDGKADILWRNTDGTVATWLMNGLASTGNAVLMAAGAGFSVTHTGDLNGDGKADILWQHTDGRVAAWLMNGTTGVSGAFLMSAGSGWTISHVADLNGDGKADILWRHTDGRVAVWLMNGLAPSNGAVLMAAGSGWSVSNANDLDGDGKADILWKHTDGRTAVWLMNGVTSTNGAVLTAAGSGWSITHTADLDGDGKADILWQHTDGRVAGWLMSGVTPANGAVFMGAGMGWTIAQMGDVDGDGKADIVWRHTDGRVAIWQMSALTPIGAAVILGAGPNQLLSSLADIPTVQLRPQADAARLLAQATFGATQTEINRVYTIGAAAYLEEQLLTPPTSHLNTVRNDPKYPTAPYAVMTPSIWKQYFENNDQLRQKVVSALSQIIVVSLQNNTVGDQPCGMAAYLDVLGRNAFGNFRNILKEVTLTPAMGEYLDMKQSAKADPLLNSVASENYARELLQLFSIGTAMLNQDGSVQFSGGKAVSTYSEATVQEFARALTGWTFAGQDQTKTWRWLYPDVPYPADTSVAGQAEKACIAFSTPMQPWTATYRSGDNKRDITGGAHDTSAKTLLTYPGSTAHKQSLPAGQTPEQDLDDVIENVFNHPNVGPFISEQLIQRLVTSNPSGAYVARIAGVFNNNGAGVRGDMRAVVKAILLDPEARAPISSQPASYGKLREPIQRFTHFHRAFGAKRGNGYYDIYDLGSSDSLGQSPLRAPSVFNYYHPDFAPSGALANAGLVGPEFEITNSATISGFMDFSKYAIINGFGQYESDQTKWIKPDYGPYITLAANPAQLVDAFDLLLLSGSMSSQFRAQLVDVVTKLTDSNATTQNTERVKTALFLILNSPEYSIQK
jgi:uncharacterized protein (DUF1800 family)